MRETFVGSGLPNGSSSGPRPRWPATSKRSKRSSALIPSSELTVIAFGPRPVARWKVSGVPSTSERALVGRRSVDVDLEALDQRRSSSKVASSPGPIGPLVSEGVRLRRPGPRRLRRPRSLRRRGRWSAGAVGGWKRSDRCRGEDEVQGPRRAQGDLLGFEDEAPGDQGVAEVEGQGAEVGVDPVDRTRVVPDDEDRGQDRRAAGLGEAVGGREVACEEGLVLLEHEAAVATQSIGQVEGGAAEDHARPKSPPSVAGDEAEWGARTTTPLSKRRLRSSGRRGA